MPFIPSNAIKTQRTMLKYNYTANGLEIPVSMANVSLGGSLQKI